MRPAAAASSAPNLSQLIAASAAGDAAAFARLYDRTHAHLFGVACRLLTNHHLAEDVLQEAFVSIWKNAAGHRAVEDVGASSSCLEPHHPDGRAMAWLIAVVRNKALDALRGRARRREDALPGIEAADEDTARTPHTGAAANPLELLQTASESLRIGDCLRALDGTHRQSLALAYYQGLTHTEIAAQMGAPLGSVKAWVRRGLDKLRACLDGRVAAAPRAAPGGAAADAPPRAA